MGVLELLPDSAAVEDGELALGGVRASALAERVRDAARRLLRGDGSRAGARLPGGGAGRGHALRVEGVPERRAARACSPRRGSARTCRRWASSSWRCAPGVPAERIVVHGNNKSDEELRARGGGRRLARRARRGGRGGAGRRGRRASACSSASRRGSTRTRTTRSRRATAARSSGCRRSRRCARSHARASSGSTSRACTSTSARSSSTSRRRGSRSTGWPASRPSAARSSTGRRPVVDAGGGLGIRYVETDAAPTIRDFAGTIVDRVERAWALHGLPVPQLVFEPGRSLVGEAGVTLYRVGVVKRASETTTYVAVDGGMSDNPRPQLYEARFSCLLANRADEPPAGTYTVCGKHCESGDVLVERAPLPAPARGDLLGGARRRARTRWRWPRTTTRCRGRRPCSSPAARRG